LFGEKFALKNESEKSTPETQENQSEKQTLKSLIEKAIKSVVDFVPKIFKDDLEDEIKLLENFKNQQESLMDIGQEAHAYCAIVADGIYNNGLNLKNRLSDSNNSLSFRQFILQSVKNVLNMKNAFENNKKARQTIKDITKEIAPTENYFEETSPDGTVIQKAKFLVEGKDKKINEIIENRIYQGEVGNNSASEILIELPDGKNICLNDLLPGLVRANPGSLFVREECIDNNDDGVKYRILTQNLKNYKDTANRYSGEFSCLTYVQKDGTVSGLVNYGNLAKKGGILSYLHENGHAWKVVYDVINYEKNYEEILKIINIYSWILTTYRKDYEEGKIDKEDYMQKIEYFLDKLDAEEIAIYRRDSLENIELNENEFIVRNLINNQDYLVKSRRLKEALDHYALQERNAWAHAIKTLRFLRKKGIDLEPELKTPEDFKEVVQVSLETYQQRLKNEIIATGSRYRKFTTK